MFGLIQVPIVLTFAAHLICMNVCSAGPLLCIWLERRFVRTGEPLALQLGKQLAQAVLLTFFVGIGFGFLLAGLLWASGRHDFFDALPAFSYKIWWGVWELVAFLIASVLYTWMWPTKKVSGVRTVAHRFLAVFAATNLLYHFPPLFAAIAKFDASDTTIPITPAEFRRIVFQHEVISISVHFWLASIAIAGGCVIILARRHALTDSPITWPVVGAARISLVATAFQFAVGLWVALKLPPSEQNFVMGGNMLATGCLLLSVGLSFDLLGRLTSLSFGDVTIKGMRSAVGRMVAIVVFMSATLWLVQQQ